MMQPIAREKQVGLEVGLDTRISFVHGDPDRILEVLINLIDNGIKFTPANGAVTVQASLVPTDPDFVYVSVTDTGRGISPEAIALIFERLFQDPNAIDNSRKGLGLGLFIAKELVRLHGGRISGRQRSWSWQHLLVYLAAVFAGQAAVSGDCQNRSLARCHRPGQSPIETVPSAAGKLERNLPRWFAAPAALRLP
jgi:signal transduction histidine kinase